MMEQIARKYIEQFNRTDEEFESLIPNRCAADWMLANTPLVSLPDAVLEQTYYFRWWTYRKHIKKTPDGMVVTEFLRDVPWAGLHNTIVAAAGHHIDEGRWLRDTAFLDEYIEFYYSDSGSPRLYSNWLEHSVLGLCEVRGNASLGVKLLEAMTQNQLEWDKSNLHKCGLYWSSDDRDAGELSISGNGLRPTLNSYQYANKKAVAAFSRVHGKHELADNFTRSAGELRDKINRLLWNNGFYRTIPLQTRESSPSGASDVRELWGYWPWLFGVAPQGRSEAFKQLIDPAGFRGEYGLTTAERRHKDYGIFYSGHECQWNGPSWPFSSCMAIGALANLIVSGERQSSVSADVFYRLLAQYARSHVRMTETGAVSWIDENLHPDTGDWISRTRLAQWADSGWSDEKGGYERGKDYNHSTFCNLVIGGLFGVRPTLDSLLITPLFPKEWPYARLKGLKVHGHDLAILYDNPQTGGDGYKVYVDKECVFQSDFPQNTSLIA